MYKVETLIGDIRNHQISLLLLVLIVTERNANNSYMKLHISKEFEIIFLYY